MKTYLKQTIGLSVLCLVMIAGGDSVWAQTKQTAEQELPEAAINEDRVWKPRAVEIEISTPDPLPVFNPPSTSYRKDLLTAMDYHNMANAVQAMIDSNDYRDTLVDLALVERRMSDLEKCNVNLLSKNFSDPQNVWNKMKSEADRMSQEYALSDAVEMKELSEQDLLDMATLTGVDSEQQTDRQETTNETTDSNAGNTNLIDWDIGYSILKDLYANQDNWGSRLSSTSPSFSLWDDQKYLYDTQVWNPKYTAINAYFGVDPNGRPQGVNEKKYDYYFYKDVRQAHQNYLASLAAQTGKPIPVGQLGEAPQVAPRPLAPRQEIVLIQVNDNNAFDGVYPGYPQPWQTFIDSGFTTYNPNGEMAQVFKVNLSKRTISPKSLEDGSVPNRISRYLTTKYELNKKQEELEEQNNRVAELKEKIEAFATDNEIQLPQDMNYADPEDLVQIKTLLLQERDKKIAKAKPLMKEGSEPIDLVTRDNETKQEVTAAENRRKQLEALVQYDDVEDRERIKEQIMAQDEAERQAAIARGEDVSDWEAAVVVDYGTLVEALEYDVDAEVAVSFSNVDTIKEAIKEARANAKITELSNKEKQKAREKELADLTKPIDSMCSNGGIQGTFDINAIQIP